MAGGTYRPRVFFNENGQPDLRLDHEPVNLSSGKARLAGGRLVVDAKRLEIRGTVRDRAGALNGQARVVASNGHEGNTAPLATVFTDAHGAFAFGGRAGTYTLEADTGLTTGSVTV